VLDSVSSVLCRDWLGRTSLKWPILCGVGRKTLTQSISFVQSAVFVQLAFISSSWCSWVPNRETLRIVGAGHFVSSMPPLSPCHSANIVRALKRTQGTDSRNCPVDIILRWSTIRIRREGMLHLYVSFLVSLSMLLCTLHTCGVCIRSWLLAKDIELRGKPLQLGRTYYRRRTLRKTKTAGKSTGNHPGKYVIRENVSMQPHHSAV